MPYDTLFVTFALVALGVVTLARMAGPGRRNVRWMPAVVLSVAGCTLAVTYAGGAALLGRPKPARLEVVSHAGQDVQVAGSHYVEGTAIYLWLLRPGEDAPRAYALPWSRENAEALQKARSQAEANGTEVRMRGDLQPRSQEGGVVFYAPPPPPMPVKRAG